MNKTSCFKSERLFYRGIAKDDAELIVQWRSRKENYKNFFNAHAVTMQEHLSWFDRYLTDKTRYDFMILDNNNTAIGTVGLSDIDGDSCEISYMIGDESARGKGYAKEAVEAMSSFAFSELGVAKVIARIKPENKASIHVVNATGFTQTEIVYSLEETIQQ